jgi:8-oxo-dGTP diphosphatase
MWLFTPEGFYSIVTAEELGHPLQVRARCAEDLDRLRRSYLPELGPTVAIPHRDYPWRAYTTRQDLAACLARMADRLDYHNFKDAVAARLSPERAHLYHAVWADCQQIPAHEAAATDPATPPVPPADATAASGYGRRDLHAEGIWPKASRPRYGGVVFDAHGRVLLREPAGHFDGYHWTFPKGTALPGEHPADAALRETLEETGCRAVIVGHLPEGFTGGVTGSTNFYYLMRAGDDPLDDAAVAADGETQAVRWATPDEARRLISQSTNPGGRDRDLRTLAAACRAIEQLAGNDRASAPRSPA